MRFLLWALGLFALAVGLTVGARFVVGYVLIVLPGERIEVMLFPAILLFLASLGVFYLLVRAAVLALGLPARARAFREEQQRVRARRAFESALAAYFEGRFGRARKAAAQAVALGESPALALVVSARAAHELRDFAGRDAVLAEMERLAPGEAYLRLMTQAELLLAERRHLDALRALSLLQDKHTAALRLELRAQQQARNWGEVLALLPQLEKRRALEPAVLRQVRRAALVAHFEQMTLEPRAVTAFWERLPAEDRHDARVAGAAAQCLHGMGATVEARAVVERTLEAQWDPALLPLLGEIIPAGDRRALEAAEGWLARHPGDPMLLLALGQLCLQQGLWGKARSYLEASLALQDSHTGRLALARLLEQTGAPAPAQAAYRQALDLALAQLRESSGGRRRPQL